MAIPTLVQLSAVELTKGLKKKQSRILEYKVQQYLPRNLKDIVRKQCLNQSDCAFNLLPFVIHDRVAQLDLSDIAGVTNLDFLRLCPLLTKLNLRNCLSSLNANVDFNAVFSQLLHLQVVFLHFNPTLSDEALIALSNHNYLKLRELDLEYCSSLTDRGLSQVKKMHALQCLNLAFTNITDFAVGEIFGRGDMNVTELRLDHCGKITDESIEIILEHQRTKLDIFIMHACPLLTSKSVQSFESVRNVKQVTWTIY